MYFCEKHKNYIGPEWHSSHSIFWTRLRRSGPIKVGLKDVGLNDRAWTSYTRFFRRAKWVHCRPLDPDEECRWFKDISSTSPYLASPSSRESSKTVKGSAKHLWYPFRHFCILVVPKSIVVNAVRFVRPQLNEWKTGLRYFWCWFQELS
jgi:hypothetical protein